MKHINNFSKHFEKKEFFYPLEELKKLLSDFKVETLKDESEISDEPGFVRGFKTIRLTTPKDTTNKRGTFEVYKNNKFIGYITVQSKKSITESGFDDGDIMFYSGGIFQNGNKLDVNNLHKSLKQVLKKYQI